MRSFVIIKLLEILLKRQLDFNGLQIIHEVKPRLKNIYIRIDEQGEIVVRSSSLSESKLLELLQKKERWIRQHLKQRSPHSSINLGEEIYFLGELHQIIDSEKFTMLRQSISRLKSKDKAYLQKQYHSFYRLNAESYLTQRVEHFSKQMKLYPSTLKFRRMKSRWGSCSSHEVITFNTLLMQLSAEHIDYVVVHELAHLKHMNHSKAFHTLVASHLKNANNLRRTMKEYRLPNI